MHPKRALFIGMLGAGAMSFAMAIARIEEMTALNLEFILGSFVTRQLSPSTWVLGLGIHLIAGGVFALIYAAFFERAGRASLKVGALLGVIHGLISGVLMMVLPSVHPLMRSGVPESLPAPGFSALHYGWLTGAAFLLLHGLYGAMVGGLYETKYINFDDPRVPSSPPGNDTRRAA